MIATMLATVKLLGTSLTLKKGDCVYVTPATNLPKAGKFYAAPTGEAWGENSILISSEDFEIVS